MNSIPRRYLLLEIDNTNELVILETKNVKYVSELLEKCDMKEQLAAFARVEAFWQGREIFGSPLFVSVDEFECEKERFRLLNERRVALSDKQTNRLNEPTASDCVYPFPTPDNPASGSQTPSVYSEHSQCRYTPGPSVTSQSNYPDYNATSGINPVVSDEFQSGVSEVFRGDEISDNNSSGGRTISYHDMDTGRVNSASTTSSRSDESFHEKSFSPDSDSIARAKKMLLYPDTRDAWSEDIVRLWAYVLEIEDKQKALNVRNTVNQAFESEFIIVGDQYNVNRLAVARGLSERNTIESYFRHLIRETWPKEEYINRTVTGKNGKLAVDKTRLSAFINYAIFSWNEYHGKNPGSRDLVIKKSDIHRRRNKLRSVCSQFCSDATRRSRSTSPPTATT